MRRIRNKKKGKKKVKGNGRNFGGENESKEGKKIKKR